MEKGKKSGLKEKTVHPAFTIVKICEDLEKIEEELGKFLEKKKDNPLAKHVRYYDEYYLIVKDEFTVHHHKFGEIKLTKGLYHLRFWLE